MAEQAAPRTRTRHHHSTTVAAAVTFAGLVRYDPAQIPQPASNRPAERAVHFVVNVDWRPDGKGHRCAMRRLLPPDFPAQAVRFHVETWKQKAPGEKPVLVKIVPVENAVVSHVITRAGSKPEVDYGLDAGDPGFKIIKVKVDRILRRRSGGWKRGRYDKRSDRCPVCFEDRGLHVDAETGALSTSRPPAAPLGVRLALELYDAAYSPVFERPPQKGEAIVYRLGEKRRKIHEPIKDELDALPPAQIIARFGARSPLFKQRLDEQPALEAKLLRLIDRRAGRSAAHHLVIALAAAAAPCSAKTILRWVRPAEDGFFNINFAPKH
jgi:hypothetical protein